MIGQTFHCTGCHNLRAVQDGFVVEHLNLYVVKPELAGIMPGMNAHMTKLTNGAQALFVPLIVCATCLPAGADATPLSEIGVRG